MGTVSLVLPITNPLGGERGRGRQRDLQRERIERGRNYASPESFSLSGQPTIHILLSNVSHYSFSPHKIVGIPIDLSLSRLWEVFTGESSTKNGNFPIAMFKQCLYLHS